MLYVYKYPLFFVSLSLSHTHSRDLTVSFSIKEKFSFQALHLPSLCIFREYPIARAFVDARVQRIYGGANEIMKVCL